MSAEAIMANYTLQLVDKDFLITSETKHQLLAILKQKDIKALFSNEEMNEAFIKKYLEWYIQAAYEGKCYLYLVRDKARNICAGIDVQIANSKSVSLGFWKDKNCLIRMSMVIVDIISICRLEGYNFFDSYVEKDNKHAQNLLERVGFSYQEDTIGKSGKRLMKYILL